MAELFTPSVQGCLLGLSLQRPYGIARSYCVILQDPLSELATREIRTSSGALDRPASALAKR